MRILAGLSMTLLFSGALFGQYHSGARAGNGGFHSGSGFHVGNSGVIGGRRVTRGSGAVIVPYAYPVYLGSGYSYPTDYSNGYADGNYVPPPTAQPSNVTVVYPPEPAPGYMNQFGPGPMPPPGAGPQPVSPYPPPSAAQSDDQNSADHYLIALKDHTIYSVVAYWVDGDTLHYFTAGNIHNQASLSLVDVDLTARLNKESGQDVKIPAPK
jgi:hypothetical protein